VAEDQERAPGLSRRKFLQGIGTGAVAVSVAPTQLTATHNETMTAKSTRPNIVYFFVDDMGYGDASCLNPDGKIQTPNIDRLAREGMMFTDAHSSSAVCSPSRYSLLTGRYNLAINSAKRHCRPLRASFDPHRSPDCTCIPQPTRLSHCLYR